ncbi:hypothetical protein MVLG_06625 [Microbotryum lychnidis-dioicae p1A1 Lamole]|uniref:Uncharacterized protein n=3 Tax=Microbotryum TaxID=34416 RepID=U5HHV4_USTV1|nr:hypothetical protein MVLG_06625 [Microbotryum lychnidis-dioicae p1A1 Lamole]SCZ87753.1 BZ3500_MvSof-1268-A1-R1_Chr2-3g05221 [Microbotryum saponariae]SDA01047.1 BZ3501_MvSof-1269-A2-R1_Chr2-2g04894 [Microbotryum saponariae]SGZ31887.1 BQ5605_C042g12030 [Microbotryum silenes-dioicae]|eukprot:KDE02834.1 hypothetical protein MVLG_06625 [Microbotryum lychnidis-dioicae p1A1 Lamole]
MVCLFLIWHFRAKYIDHLPPALSSRLRYYAPLSTFEDAAEQGFSTAAFDLSGNMAGDSRAGLDDRTLTEVRRIMEEKRCNFDEARVIHTNRMFARNGIDPNGYPLDPKAITRLS